MKIHLQKLLEIARLAGASDACFLHSKDLVVEDELAGYCLNPRCENYGKSPSCPPHVEGPEAFRKWSDASQNALALKIDVPTAVLNSHERREVMRLLHEIVAKVELHAVEYMYPKSKGFAGGSCKNIFCHDHTECLRLSDQGVCRYPLHARPSMSGFGVNVARMMSAAGWSAESFKESHENGEPMSWVAGLVLISK